MFFFGFLRNCREVIRLAYEYVLANVFFVGVALIAIILCGGVFGALYTHFFLGLDIPKLAVFNEATASYWGQLGDFAGGFLNPLLSFLALMAVLKTMALQREEMKAAQLESRTATQEQKQQTAVYSKQMFESTLFGMLDVHAKILKDISYVGGLGSFCEGRRAVDLIVKSFKNTDAYEAGQSLFGTPSSHEVMQNQVDAFCNQWKGMLGHYYRNLYWIMKMIDTSHETIIEERHYRVAGRRRFYMDYVRKRNYTNIVRAQLSDSEMALLQINCLGDYGVDLKYYVEFYSLLKPLGKDFFGQWGEYMCSKFDDMAFSGLEEIDVDVLAEHRGARVKFNSTRIRRNSSSI